MKADVIVVGLGAVGAATLYQLARRGVSALGVDRFSPPHDLGSSHGETRITREGVGEGEAYVPLAIRSHAIWRELEAQTGADLLLTCGALMLGPSDGRGSIHGTADFVTASAAAARRFCVPHERLTASEIAARYPQLQLRGDEHGYFEPGGGIVYPERCIAAQLAGAERLGARVLRDRPVLRIDEGAHGVRVETDQGFVETGQVVVAAGAWTPALIGQGLGALRLQPQVLHWFAPLEGDAYRADRFPVFIWPHGPDPEDSFYGFPVAPGAPTQAIKVATETTATVALPDAALRFVDPGAAERMYARHLAGRLRGLTPRAVKSVACVYTTAPDNDFVIGRPPGRPRTLVASCCSGHGFKHSAAVGERLADAVLGDAVLGDAPSAVPRAFDLERLWR